MITFIFNEEVIVLEKEISNEDDNNEHYVSIHHQENSKYSINHIPTIYFKFSLLLNTVMFFFSTGNISDFN